MNLFNNLFTNYFLYADGAKLVVSNWCFFKNTPYTNFGNVEVLKFISDGATGATIHEDVSTVMFSINEYRTSQRFTHARRM